MPSNRTGWIIETRKNPTMYLEEFKGLIETQGRGESWVMTEYPGEAKVFAHKADAKKFIDANPMLTQGGIIEASKAPLSAREYVQMLLAEEIPLEEFLRQVTVRPFN